jgi:plastocyanin
MEGREQQAREGIRNRASARRRWLGFGSVSAAVIAGAVLLSAGDGHAARAADVTVEARDNFFFSPVSMSSAVVINQGETVTWVNAGTRPHNVRFDDGSFDEPPNPTTSSWTVQRTFNAPGTFRYYCEAHGGPGGAGMAGTVTVNAVPSPPAPPPPPPPGGTPPPPGGTPPPPGGTPPPPGGTPPPGGGTTPGAPSGGKASTTVTLQVSDRTPARGQRVRFFGSVRPEQDGRLVQLQRRARGGSYRTVVRIKLQDAGANRSKFSRRLRMLRDGVFRARLPADSDHKQGTSRTTRVDVR